MISLYKYIAVFFLATTIILGIMYNYANLKVTRLESEKNAFETQLEKEHNDKVELDKQYKKLEAKAKSDKSFNWYADISSSPVVIELHD